MEIKRKHHFKGRRLERLVLYLYVYIHPIYLLGYTNKLPVLARASVEVGMLRHMIIIAIPMGAAFSCIDTAVASLEATLV